jgi:hypothetical protein
MVEDMYVFATEERICSWNKLLRYDDRGKLQVTKGGMRFEGKSKTFEIPRESIRSVSKCAERISYPSYLLIFFIAIAFCYFIPTFYERLQGFFTGTFIVALIVFEIINFIFISRKKLWTLVEYIDETDTKKKAYFSWVMSPNGYILPQPLFNRKANELYAIVSSLYK